MKKYSKKLLSLLLALGLVLGLPLGAFAQEEAQDLAPIISDWALEEVSEAQFIGLIGMNPELAGKDFTQEITQDQVKGLANKTNEILSQALGKEVEPLEYETLGVTRGEVLNHVFYSLENSLDEDLGDPIKYLSENNILRGYGDSESHLERKSTYEEGVLFFVRAIQHVYKERGLGGKGVFYKLENDGNTVYLLGSIHVGRKEFYPLNSILTDSLQEADKLFLEIDITDPEIIMEILEGQSRAEDEPSLEEEIGPNLYRQLVEISEETGIPMEVFEEIKTELVANAIYSLIGDPYGSALGIDNYFANKANVNDMEIESVEEVQTQIDALSMTGGEDLDDYKENLQEAIDTFHSVEAREAYLDEIAQLQKTWANNDGKGLAENLELESDNPLLKDRDPQMASFIKDLLEDGSGKTYYVIVGAAHLLSDQSVLDYLEDYGYQATDLFYNKSATSIYE